ncbi:MAG: hypothetical protein V2J24_17110 [Pseudomonadales bacterium]|nr:hypothetical protein [Pseudomonadales bacterium]
MAFELLLSLTIVGFAVHQVVSTRRLLREREEREAREEADDGA